MLCEGHPQAGGLIVRGKGTWEAVQAAPQSALLFQSKYTSAADVAQQSEPDLEPEPEPSSDDEGGSPTAAAHNDSIDGRHGGFNTDCKMLLKKDLQEASGLNALITRADALWHYRQVRLFYAPPDSRVSCTKARGYDETWLPCREQWCLVRTECEIGELTTIDGRDGVPLASNGVS